MRRGFQGQKGVEEETYDIRALQTYYKYYVKKIITLQALLPQFLFILALTILIFNLIDNKTLNEVSYSVRSTLLEDYNLLEDSQSSRYNNKIQFSDENEGHDVFVNSPAQVYAWIEKVFQKMNDIQSLDDETSSSTTTTRTCCRIPIGGLVIRHFKVRPEACPKSNAHALFQSRHNHSYPKYCYPEYISAENADTLPLTPLFDSSTSTSSISSIQYSDSAWNGTEFFTQNYSLNGYLRELNGRHGDYIIPNSGIFLSFVRNGSATANSSSGVASSTSNVQQLIAELKAGQWIRRGTRAISVEGILFHTHQNQFVAFTALLEISTAGGFVNTLTTRSFRIHRVDTAYEIGIFLMDLLLLVCLLYLLLELLYRLSVGYELKGSIWRGLEFSDMFQFCVIALLATMMGMEFQMLNEGINHLPSGNSDAGRTNSSSIFSVSSSTHWQLFLFDQADRTAILSTITAWTVFGSYFRLLFFLRYATRLSLVNETLISGIHDFVGIGLVAVLILIAYALTGHILWMHTPTGFQSFGGSLMMLFNIMISLEINDYDIYLKYNPRSTQLYFATFFVVAWCVILNVTVGILATSFAAALETQTFIRRPDWSLKALIRDIASLFSRFRLGKLLLAAASSAQGAGQDPTSPASPITAAGGEGNAKMMQVERFQQLKVKMKKNGYFPYSEEQDKIFSYNFVFRCFMPMTKVAVLRALHAAKVLRALQEGVLPIVSLKTVEAEVEVTEDEEGEPEDKTPKDGEVEVVYDDKNTKEKGGDAQRSHRPHFERHDDDGVVESVDLAASNAAAPRSMTEETELFEHHHPSPHSQQQPSTMATAEGQGQPPQPQRYKSMKTISLHNLCAITDFAPEEAKRMCAKSLLHIGLHDAKLRQWKMLQEAVEGGHDVTNHLNIEFRQLQQIHEHICGSGSTSAPGNGAEQDPFERNMVGDVLPPTSPQKEEENEKDRKQKEESSDALEKIRNEIRKMYAGITLICNQGDERIRRLEEFEERLNLLLAELELSVDQLTANS